MIFYLCSTLFKQQLYCNKSQSTRGKLLQQCFTEDTAVKYAAETIKNDTLISFQSLLEVQNQPFRGVLIKRCSGNIQHICTRTPTLTCDFIKAALQLYWNRTLALVFFYKFVAYFQNSFYKNTSGSRSWITP